MSTAGAGGGAGGGRRVTVRSVSCRGVKAFVPFQKPPLYVAVSLAGRREKTNGDPDGGENPDWDGAVFAFDLSDGGGAAADGGVLGDDMLQFEVKAQVPLLGNKLVGKVSVLLADLVGGDGMAPRHVSYQVCAPDGKANGKLSFTYAITGGSRAGAYQQPQQDPTSCCAPPPPSGTLYPPPAMASSVPHISGSSSYPPLASLSAPTSSPLYPPPPSSYPPPPPLPPPPTPDSHFPAQNFPPNSSYPPPPPPPSNFYPPPPAGYPAPSFPSPTSTYPPPPESGTRYPPLPRSAPCSDCSLDRALPSYMSPPPAVAYPPPSGVPCYNPPATWLPEEAAGAPYSFYPQPGTRYL